VTVTKTTGIRRLQECKCRSYDDLGKPGTSNGTSRIVRYEQDGLQDAKMDTCWIVQYVLRLCTGKGQSGLQFDLSRVLKLKK
jgi:hypothetical protein